MKFEIVREKLPVPPVEKIVLELTPGELVRLRRAFHHGVGDIDHPLSSETAEAVTAADVGEGTYLHSTLFKAAQEAGLAR